MSQLWFIRYWVAQKIATNWTSVRERIQSEALTKPVSVFVCLMNVFACAYGLCSLRTRQPAVRYSTFELKAAKSGQTRSEWMSHGRGERARVRNVQWIVNYLVGSCDVNSTDRATLHTHATPINLLKWISNATLGASTDLKLLSQTHTETKHTIFISSLGLWGKVSFGYSWDVQDKHGSNGQKRHMISFSSLHKYTISRFLLHAVKRANSLLALRREWDLVCYSGHLL